MSNESRRKLLAQREDVQRHLKELSRGAHRHGSSPASRQTSRRMLHYLLEDIERQLKGIDRHETR
jgi:hypothetical protein